MTIDLERIFLGGEDGRRDTPLTALPKIDRNFQEIAAALVAGQGGGYGGLSILEYTTEQELALDATAALVAAAASGERVIIPNLGFDYEVSTFLDFATGTSFIGVDQPTIKATTTARIIRCSGVSDVNIEDIVFNGNGGAVPAGNIGTIQLGCVRINIRRCRFLNARGSLAFTGATDCEIDDNDFDDGLSTAFEFNGSGVYGNKIRGNRARDNVGFGIWLTAGANRNELIGNRTFSNGLEGIGITFDSWGNRVIGNHADGCGDNGISVTGYSNTVIGNQCNNNDFHGICVYGKLNTVVGNSCKNNGQAVSANTYGGIALVGESGGIAQHNTIVGNILDDDQTSPTQDYGMKINAAAYTAWLTATAYTVGQYRTNDNKLYRCSVAGTSGATAPTHTSGEVSDGGATWLYIDSFFGGTREPYGNTVGPNTIVRSGVSSVLDGTTNRNNNIYTRDGIRLYGSGGDFIMTGLMRRRATAWQSGQSVAYGDVRYYENNHYRCIGAGTTATGSEPVHGSGSATGADGVVWYHAGPNQEAYVLQTNNARASVVGSLGIVGMDSSTEAKIYVGVGTPESKVAAPIGSLYLRTDGSTSTTLYVKTADAALPTGWTAK